MNKRTTGTEYEKIAADFLVSMGYNILERNFRTRFGEIDLIAEDASVICFIEVKYRSSLRYGYPAEAVSPRKQQKILGVSRAYLAMKGLSGRSIRYDVVEILGNQIRVLKDCFGA